MDYIDSIAMIGMSMSAANLQMDANIAIAKKAMEAQETVAAELLDMIPARVMTPGLGEYVDILA